MNPDDVSAQQSLSGLIGGFIVSQAIHAVAKLGVADRIANEPRTPGELASELGVHESALYRVMRCLAGVGVFTEDDRGAFGLTAMGELLRDDHPQSLKAWAVMAGEPWVREPWSDVVATVATGEAAFERVMGAGAYEFMAKNSGAAALFHTAMTRGSLLFTHAVLAAYDFSEVSHLVDIGGGEGAFLAEVLKAHPHMRGTVFDLPHVREPATAFLREAGLSSRCDVVSGSFHETIPVGGDAYLLKWVIHNWDDAPAIQILTQCRGAMAGSSRLILVERVLPAGDAPSDGKMLDLNMLVLQGGRERTEAEFRALLENAGFELVAVTATASPLSVIEGRVRS